LEKLPATVCLSRETPNDIEQIYSVGTSIDAVRQGMLNDISGKGRGYRYIDPFSSLTFDPNIASKAVAYLILLRLRRTMSKWCFWVASQFGHNGLQLTVRIPKYGSLSASQKIEFESGIKGLLPGVTLIVQDEP